MHYPGEKIIHCSRDQFGEIIVTDGDLLRTLYFGNEKRQSAMFLEHPGLLVMDYTQAMMLSLLFQRHPRKVFCLGLGGGSLVKFLLRACPSVSIDVVELRQRVIQVAHAFFAVPERDARLSIFQCDGAKFFGSQSDQGQSYDLMFLDAFDHEGPVEELSDLRFIEQAYSRLSDTGLLCINLWNRNGDGFHSKLRKLKSICEGAVLHYELGRKNSNGFIFCFKQRDMMLQLKRYEGASHELRSEFGINFHKHFTRLYKQNVPVIRRWLKTAV